MIVDAARWDSAGFYYLLGAFVLLLVPVATLAIRCPDVVSSEPPHNG